MYLWTYPPSGHTQPPWTQYKLLYTISNNTDIYEEPEPQAKKIPHSAVTFETSEENRIGYESLY